MNNLPTISSYGQYSSDNYGVNTLMVDFPQASIRLYFSYQTIVAFYTPETRLVCASNNWGVTTGKHLNWIQSDKSKRIPYEDFKKALESALNNHIK